MPRLPYFWFLSAAFWFITLQFARVNPAPGTWPDRPSDDELQAFRRRLLVATCGPQLLFGMLDLASGRSLPLQLGPADWSDPFFTAGFVLTVLLWGLLLWWLWLRNGAAYLARFAPAINLPSNPAGIRLVLTGIVVAGALGAFLMYSGALR